MSGKTYVQVMAVSFGFVLISTICVGCGRKETKNQKETLALSINQEALRHIKRFSDLWDGWEQISIVDSVAKEALVIGDLSFVQVQSGGNYVIYDRFQKVVRIIDPKGNCIRVIGSVGQAPGEFRAVAGIGTDSLDRIFILDPQLFRMNIYDRIGEFIRYFNVGPGSHSFAVTSAGDIVVKTAPWRQRELGIHFYDGTSGKLVRNFGPPAKILESIGMGVIGGGVALDTDDRVLRIQPVEFGAEEYELATGKLLRKITRNASYFKEPRDNATPSELLKITATVGPICVVSSILVFVTQAPNESLGVTQYLEIFNIDGEFLAGQIEIPSQYKLRTADQLGFFYFSYQPAPGQDGFLPNPSINKLHLKAASAQP